MTIVPLLEEEEEDTSSSANSYTLPVKPDDRLVIPFQNENLYAYIESADGHKKVRSTNQREIVQRLTLLL